MTFLGQLIPQLLVILQDAVVDDGEVTEGVGQWVSIETAHSTVSGPAYMPQAGAT